MTEQYDYGVQDGIGDNLLRQISETAREQIAAEAALAAAEEEVERCKKVLREISDKKLPELMSYAQQKQCTTSDGYVVTVNRFISASIKEDTPEDQKALAFKWLEDHQLGSIIKNNVIVQFGKDQNEEAKALVAALQQLTKVPITQKRSVHHMTLSATMREIYAQSTDERPEIPVTLLGVVDRTATTVKVKKT